MKKLVLILGSSLVFCWDSIILIGIRILRLPRANRHTVIVYHDVTDSDRVSFARQMALLSRYAYPCPPETILSGSSGRDGVLVTFDDAYESIFRNAIPVMEAHSVPCVVFVPVGWLAQSPGWKSHGGSARGSSMIATGETLRQHAGRMVIFGAHGIDHLSLLEASPSATHAEIVESKSRIEELVAQKVTLFAFPYGHYRPSDVELCRQSGYQAVFTATPGCHSSKENFVVSRTSVSPDDGAWEFFLKIKGAYRWQGKIIDIKRSFIRVFRRNTLKLADA